MKTEKITLIPGNTYSLNEFVSTLKKAKGAKKKFVKENGGGFYSYRLGKFIEKSEVLKLLKIVGDDESIYKFFNTCYMPSDIYIKEISKDVEKIKSNNIYDLMAAKTITHFEGGFKVLVKYGADPILITMNFSEDTTLSMRDINSFM